MTHRILITGGFGYVGGRVAMAFASLPNTQVLLGTRFARDCTDWLPNASVIVTEWSNSAGLEKICEGIDSIIHLVAMNEIDAANSPADALGINGVATARLIEAAVAANVKKFIYLSTVHVYGSPLEGVIDETVCPRPIHPYATSHRAAEDVVLAAHSTGKLTGIVIRLSNSFGAPAHHNVNRWTLLVNDLCRQAVTTHKLKLHSAGLQRRDFITLTDVCRALIHLHGLDNKYLADGIFNVGGEWAPTIYEMTNLIATRCEEQLGFLPKITRPDSIGNETNQYLDFRIDKLKSTGFELMKNHGDEIDDLLLFCEKGIS